MTENPLQPLREAEPPARESSDRETSTLDYNLLIISDMHLGEHIKEHLRIDYLKRMVAMDRDLCDFLEYYSGYREDGKPWRLVINGDLLDFLTITITPSEDALKRLPQLSLDDEEKQYGLDNEEEKAAWKIDRLVERHQMFFTYLADFVGHGNRLDFVYGNHDIELYWPQAQKALINQLVDIYFGSETVPGQTEEDYRERIRFHPWFLYEKGRYLIDHGNQYDDFTSFDHRLCPLLPFDPRSLAMPVSHFAIRYFVNQFKGFRSHNKDTWTMWDFIKWMGRQGWRNYWFVLKSYFLLTKRILAYSLRISRADRTEIEAKHHTRLDQLADTLQVSRDTLGAIDDLRRRPIHFSLGGTIQATALDRWALIVLGVLLFLFMLLLPGSVFTVIGILLIATIAIFRHPLLKLLRNHLLGGEVKPGASGKLEQAAQRLAELLDVRYVILGHSHRPRLRQLQRETACWYLNEGCWLPPEIKERHQGGCRSRLTYCLLLNRVLPHARIFRWCQRFNRPEPFYPHLVPDEDLPEVISKRESSDFEDFPAIPGRDRRLGYPPLPPSESSIARRSLRKQRY